MNQTTRAASVRRHVKSYEERSEVWKADYDIAMHCYDVQESIAYGMFVYDRISRFDEDLHESFFTEKTSFNAEIVNDLQGLYRQWAAVGKDLVQAIEELGKRGYVIDRAGEFRQRIQEAKGAAAPDSEFFTGGSLSILRDEAIDAHLEGKTEALEV
jgi:hypothetical protein